MDFPTIDFSQLETREIGSWPPHFRIAVIIGAGILSILVVYFLLISGQLDSLEMARKQQEDKRKDYAEKYGMAVNLNAYKEQMVQIQKTYQGILKQLPDSSQIPELLDSISGIAAADNLKFQSIRLGDPKSNLGFYKELPIQIAVTGGYHDFGKFVSDLSKLPRIVTLHDFVIKPAGKEGGGTDLLYMEITAKTYWLSYDEESEPAKTPGKAGPTQRPAQRSMPGKPQVPVKGNTRSLPATKQPPAMPGDTGKKGGSTSPPLPFPGSSSAPAHGVPPGFTGAPGTAPGVGPGAGRGEN